MSAFTFLIRKLCVAETVNCENLYEANAYKLVSFLLEISQNQQKHVPTASGYQY